MRSRSAALTIVSVLVSANALLAQAPAAFDAAKAAALAATTEVERTRCATRATAAFLRLPQASSTRRDRLGAGIQMALLAGKAETALGMIQPLDLTAPHPADVVEGALATYARTGDLGAFLSWHDRGLTLEYDATIARALNSTQTLLMPLADTALRRGETVAGRRTFELLAKLQPPAGWRLANLALTYRCIDRIADAERWYQRALELSPNDNQIQNDYGLLLRATGRLAAARRAFERSYQLDTAPEKGQAGQGPAITNLVYEHAILPRGAVPQSPDPLPRGSAALGVRPSAKMLSRVVLDLALDRLAKPRSDSDR